MSKSVSKINYYNEQNRLANLVDKILGFTAQLRVKDFLLAFAYI